MSSILAWVVLGLLASPQPRPVPTMGGGVQVEEYDYDLWSRAIEHAGLNTVQVMIYADQHDWRHGVPYYGIEAWTRLHGIREEAAAAQARGLRVILVLRLRLTRANPVNRHLWHGMVWPTDEMVDPWFDAYREFALWGAHRAIEVGADALVIGNELNSMTSTVVGPDLPDLLAYHLDPSRTAEVVDRQLTCAREVAEMPDLIEPDGKRFASLETQLRAEDKTRREWAATVSGLEPGVGIGQPPMPPALAARRQAYSARWRALIHDVRQVYKGPIGYGANFDQFEEVDFWDALDFISVSSYFSLRPLRVDDLSVALHMGWQRVAARIEVIAQRFQRPVVMSELGWSRKEGSTIRPYSYWGVEPIEVTSEEGTELTCIHWATQPEGHYERVEALAALLAVVEEGAFPSLRGFSIWKMTTEPAHLPHAPFAVLLPLPFVPHVPYAAIHLLSHLEFPADDGFVHLAARLLEALDAQVP